MKSDSEEGEIARGSGSEASFEGQDDQEDTLEIKPPQRPQRERSDGRGDRNSGDWERRDPHKEISSSSSRGQERRHRSDKHHKSRHRERERDEAYRNYDRRRDDAQRSSRESSRHTSRDRRERR
ncbi:cyclin-dependent kinase 11B-like, partial [Tropilaelaps mercedesae]